MTDQSMSVSSGMLWIMRENMIYLRWTPILYKYFLFFYFLGTLTVANSPSQFKPPINQPYANRLAFLATLPLNERLGYFKAQILKPGAKALSKGSNTLLRVSQNLNSVAANFVPHFQINHRIHQKIWSTTDIDITAVKGYFSNLSNFLTKLLLLK